MLVTYLEAARIAGVTKGAVRKAVATGKLTSTRDEGRWRVHAADVQRIWDRPGGGDHRAPVGGDQRAPLSDSDQAPESRPGFSPMLAELRARLEAEIALRAAAEDQVRDLRRRLDAADEERRGRTCGRWRLVRILPYGRGDPARSLRGPDAGPALA